MKNLFLYLVAAILLSQNLYAQPDTIHWGAGMYEVHPHIALREYPYDTVRFGDHRFLFNGPYDLYYIDGLPQACMGGMHVRTVLQYITPEAKLHGIGVVCYILSKDPDSLRVVFSAYKRENGEMRLLDTVDFTSYHVANAFELEVLELATDKYEYGYPYLYELYFDQQHDLSAGDTIYVGLQSIESNIVQHYAGYAFFLHPSSFTPNCWYGNHYGDGWSRFTFYNLIWGGFFPIVQPDQPHCRVPRRFAVDSRQSLSSASFSWASKPCDCDTLELRLHTLDSLGRPADSLLHTVHGDTACTLAGLDTGIYYSASLRARCHHRCPSHDTLLHSSWTAPLRFYLGKREPTLVDTTLGIPAAPQPPPFDLYPNPTTGILNVELGNLDFEGAATLQLLDLEGRLLQEFKIPDSKFEIDVGTLPSGTYLVRIVGGRQTAVCRLVVK